ncbi:MAG TPA: hypothetical protein ENJ18_02870 [Nannocystis exedens]|nr:hypothetical protein [Nannocystis exedens]
MTMLITSPLIAALMAFASAPETVVVEAPAETSTVVVQESPPAVVPVEARAPEEPLVPAEAPAEAPTAADRGETVLIVPATAAGADPVVPAADVSVEPVYRPVIDPIPPPPAPASRSDIRRGPWRGRWWMGMRVGITGPLGGKAPARPSIGSLTGGVDLGYRLSNWLGVGTGISGQLHDRIEVTEDGATRNVYGTMLFWDPLYLRVFMPLKRRVQPFVELGGGLAAYQRPEGGYLVGGQLRTALGLEGWVTPNMTLGLVGNYRLTRLRQRFADAATQHPVGHSYQVLAELGLHW